MVVGLGIDLVDQWRIQRAIERHGDRFVKRVFTDGEIAYCGDGKLSTQRYAARFAAKEAAVKALGTGFRAGIGMRDVEVVKDESGKPTIVFHRGAAEAAAVLGASRALLSITHSLKQAAAVVVLESEPGS